MKKGLLPILITCHYYVPDTDQTMDVMLEPGDF